MARLGLVRQSRRGSAWRDQVRCGGAEQAWLGKAWLGEVWWGKAGMATQVILNEDARSYLPAPFDVLLVDPPYSAHVHERATSHAPKLGAQHRDLGFDHLSDHLRNVIAAHASQARKWGLIYCDAEGLSEWRRACVLAGASYIRAVPWVRWSMPQLSGDRPPQGFELVLCFWGTQKGRKSWNGPGNLTHLAHKCLRGKDKHKTEKPLGQALDLVSWFSNPGEVVFDPCAGSGTVGLACRLLDRSYVGLEIDLEWARRAEDRLSGDLLKERDREQFEAWKERQIRAKEEMARMASINARTRARNAKEKGT